MIHKLYEVKQAHALFITLWEKVKASLEAGNKLEIEIKPENKSREQEKLYHAIIGKITKQAEHAGAKWDSESWKRFLLDQFAKDTDRPAGKIAPSLDGERIVQIGLLSREFNKEDAMEFTEWLMAWATERGFEV